jgi:D-alanine transaminase
MSTAYLNGTFLPLEQAHVSVMDRGFLFGDGVYEVIPVYGGRLFRLAAHLNRLQNSLNAIRLDNPLTAPGWESMLERLVELNDGRDQSVYLQVTRGVALRRDHAFPEDSRPTVFAMCAPGVIACDMENEPGVSAITLPDIRWLHCNVKAITLLPNILLRQQAIDADTTEAILSKDGYVTEGAASNVFIVKDGVLKTPPNSAALLPGVTRDLVLELASANGIRCREVDIAVEELAVSEEIWLTSSTREISPVVRLDGRMIGEGKPGPLWNRLIRLYQHYKEAVRQGLAA